MNLPCATSLIVVLHFVAVGCKSAPTRAPVTVEQPAPLVRQPAAPALISTVAFTEPLPVLSGGPADPINLEPIGEVLSREWLLADVEAKNPTLEAMAAAWQAAAQRYPQRIALDDPVLMGMIAPESAGSDVTETAYALQLNQKLPWFGKRRWRGIEADADADAAYSDVEDSRLQVRLAANLAYLDYFLASRLAEINRENARLMGEIRETAQSRFRAALASQQDVLQADVELADLARRKLEVDRQLHVATARINTLLRRWPDAPLPPAPQELDPPTESPDASLLWQTALRQRPDLAALSARIEAADAALELAYKNYHPDFDVFGRYDTFWQPSNTQGPLRAQVGVAVNLPVYREKLHAAVCEAQFRLNQRRAEFDARALEIQYDVVSAAHQVEESRQALTLYSDRLVPAAEQIVAALRANYLVAQATLIEVVQAQRQLVGIYERQLEAVVAYHRNTAQLNRAVAD